MQERRVDGAGWYGRSRASEELTARLGPTSWGGRPRALFTMPTSRSGGHWGPLRLRAFDTPGAAASVEAPVVEDPVEAALLKEHGS